VLVNNFSAAGGNSALLLEDAPRKPENVGDVDSRNLYAIAVSAKIGVSLQGNLRSLLAYVEEAPNTSLGELSYTTTARRIHHPHRVSFVGSTVGDICDKIKTAIKDNVGVKRRKGPRPRCLLSSPNSRIFHYFGLLSSS
jgi:acyl transferase domain-containing protein